MVPHQEAISRLNDWHAAIRGANRTCVTCKGGYQSRTDGDLTNGVVVRVGHIKVGCVTRQAFRGVKTCSRARAIYIAVGTRSSGKTFS